MATGQNDQKRAADPAEERILDNNQDPAPWRPGDRKENEATRSAAAGSTNADKQTGDPGRTPGSAEGVEDFEETGNE
jgi:hypothetical protein